MTGHCGTTKSLRDQALWPLGTVFQAELFVSVFEGSLNQEQDLFFFKKIIP